MRLELREIEIKLGRVQCHVWKSFGIAAEYPGHQKLETEAASIPQVANIDLVC